MYERKVSDLLFFFNQMITKDIVMLFDQTIEENPVHFHETQKTNKLIYTFIVSLFERLEIFQMI
jgi:hypothetical protein